MAGAVKIIAPPKKVHATGAVWSSQSFVSICSYIVAQNLAHK
jgi:hypothetical protein